MPRVVDLNRPCTGSPPRMSRKHTAHHHIAFRPFIKIVRSRMDPDYAFAALYEIHDRFLLGRVRGQFGCIIKTDRIE